MGRAGSGAVLGVVVGVVGLMPLSLVEAGVFVPPLPADGCPGCGRPNSRPHPWRCPVLVRLSAQLLHRERPGGWRGWACWLAAQAGDPWGDEARHWVAVADEPDLPPGSFCHTPDLSPAGDGMIEVPDPTAASSPGSGDILTAQLIDALTHAFGPEGVGWEVCPAPIPGPPASPPPPTGDPPCSLPAASPPPATPTPASPSSAARSSAAPPPAPSR